MLLFQCAAYPFVPDQAMAVDQSRVNLFFGNKIDQSFVVIAPVVESRQRARHSKRASVEKSSVSKACQTTPIGCLVMRRLIDILCGLRESSNVLQPALINSIGEYASTLGCQCRRPRLSGNTNIFWGFCYYL